MRESFQIGSITIYGYGLMIALGILAAIGMAEVRAKRHGLDSDRVFSLALWVLAGGWISARLLYYITILGEICGDLSLLWDFRTGYVVYGGMIGGALAGFLCCKKRRLRFEWCDLLMPSVALAQSFSRIGCFLAGCCYGREMDCPISIVFHHSGIAPNGVPLFPTQLVSSGLDFFLCLMLLWTVGRSKVEGRIFALYLILYSASRFVIEFFRGDLLRGSVGGLSTSQWIALFVFTAGVILLKSTIRRLAYR